MSVLFQKLNLKTQTDILVLNAPASFETELWSKDSILSEWWQLTRIGPHYAFGAQSI